MDLKKLYRLRILNRHFEQIGWMDKDLELAKQIKKFERLYDDTFLDSVFEEAKKEALKIIEK